MLVKINKEIRKRIPSPFKKLWRVLRQCSKLSSLLKLKKTNNFYRSYAQFGEDMILRSFFPGKTKGFYIDVGASHPHFISNTHFFYLLGWRGINIDPNPKSIELFNKLRPLDINLELAVSDSNDEQTFFTCSSSSLNTLSREMTSLRAKTMSIQFDSQKTITPKSLKAILDQYLPKDQKIDFLSVDAEGLDLNVLMSNDWEKYIPNMIIIEFQPDFDINNLGNDNIIKYLHSRGYELKCITPANLIFANTTISNSI